MHRIMWCYSQVASEWLMTSLTSTHARHVTWKWEGWHVCVCVWVTALVVDLAQICHRCNFPHTSLTLPSSMPTNLHPSFSDSDQSTLSSSCLPVSGDWNMVKAVVSEYNSVNVVVIELFRISTLQIQEAIRAVLTCSDWRLWEKAVFFFVSIHCYNYWSKLFEDHKEKWKWSPVLM